MNSPSIDQKSNPKKLFHSYCHKDEQYSKELEKRLATMKRKGMIDSWHDRKIVPGSNISEKIKENIVNSDIILFLVSPDFLDSEECIKELEESFNLAKENTNKKKLIPIILRPCDWKNEPKLKIPLALPKDGQAINTWENTDEAWEDIRCGIERAVFDIEDESCFTINESFKNEFINDIGVGITHPKKEEINLNDLFVYPSVEDYISHKQNQETTSSISSRKLIEVENCSKMKIALEGEEQIGKTSLLKTLFQDLHNLNTLPIFIKGKDIKNTNIDKIISECFTHQYIGKTFSNFTEDNRGKLIIIDDWHLAKIDQESRDQILQQIDEKSYGLIISINNTYNIAEHQLKTSKEISKFEHYQIKPFGHRLRAQLIEKWLLIGENQEYESNSEFIKQSDIYKTNIDSILGKTIIPARPLFIILILRMKEIGTSHQELNLTSYGHYYQFLVFGCLNQTAKIPQQKIDLYLNYLTELSYFIFRQQNKTISKQILESFNQSYSEKFPPTKTSFIEIIDKLKKGKLLSIDNSGQYCFKYEYIYYYFVSKYLAENISDKKIKCTITHLCSKLHNKDYANIMVFVSHHSKEDSVLDEIILTALSLYENEPPASLNKESVSFIQDVIESFKTPQLESANYKEERERRWETKDEKERKEDCEKDSGEEDAADTASKLHQGIKTIEILGQILRNRYGSLQTTKQIQIFTEGQNLGLRMLGNFHNLLAETDIDLLAEEIAKLKKKNKTQSEKEILARLMAYLGYVVTFGFMKKISLSLGSENVLSIADRVNGKLNTPASKLINFFIHQWFEKRLDFEEIKKMKKIFSNNPFATRILTDFIRDYIEMHPVTSREIHSIAGLFNIPIDKQIMIQEENR